MAIDPNELPSDPSALRQMVMGLVEEVESKERRLKQLQYWVEQLLRARYGPRRERVSEDQLFLFAAAILAQGGRRRRSRMKQRRRNRTQNRRPRAPDMAGVRCQNL